MLASRCAPRRLNRVLEISEQCTRSFEECTTSVGQFDAARRSPEQLYVKFPFNRVDQPTQRRLLRSDRLAVAVHQAFALGASALTAHGGGRRSPRGQDRLLQLRLMEKRRALVRREDVNALIDTMAGTVLTHLSGMAARCSRDLATRRAIDNVVLKIRREIAAVCVAQADAWGEPPLVQQE